MSTPYLSEIKIITWNFPPKGWAFCNGQSMPISQNAALFSLLGTFYGGDGQVNFNLPNLQARVPIHMGTAPGGTYNLGQAGGEAAHTLSVGEIPSHNHPAFGSNSVLNTGSPANGYWGDGSTLGLMRYSPGAISVGMAGNAIGQAGGGQPHPNWNPYLVLNYIIALTGTFPTRS